jgi:glycosyltransferase involved in cell wall biosynthesis
MEHIVSPNDARPPSRYRLAVLTTHAVQYQAPLFRKLAAHPRVDLTVFRCSNWGLEPYFDSGFQQSVQWNQPLLEGYRSELLRNLSARPNINRFWGLINPGIVKRLHGGQFDALIVHGWSNVTTWLAIFAALSTRTRLLMRAETNLLPRLSRSRANLKQFVLGNLFREVYGFLAIGRYNREFYRSLGVPPERICFAPYSVDNEFFLARAAELLPQRAETRRRHGIAPDAQVVLFVGKLKPTKRPDDLLAAFATMSARNPSAVLAFVGDGEMRAQLTAIAAQLGLRNVAWFGFRNQEQLPEFYSLADVFCIPSAFEPWGLVVNEAMCFNLPIVASNQVGATGDLVQDSVNGFVFPAGDRDALADALDYLLTRRAIRQRFGAASGQLISHYGNDMVTRNLVAFLDQRLASSR